MGSTPVLGPVEFLVLTFPGNSIDAGITDALTEVVSDGRVTLLDLIVLSMDTSGAITEREIDDDLEHRSVRDRLAEAGHGPRTKHTAVDVLARLRDTA